MKQFSSHKIVKAIRDRAKELAYLLKASVPPGREFSTVLTNLAQTTFWANAGIARNQE